MNFLEVLGVILIAETIVEAYLIYKYRMLVRQFFRDALITTEPAYLQQIIPEAYPKKIYRDSLGRFTRRPLDNPV